MTPPPIRYPLFWIVGLVLLGVAAWTGRDLIASARATIHSRWTRVVEGPPVPSSAEPKLILGTITRRALLLREGIEAKDRPGGKTVETIRRRMFVDIYDVWPLTGEPEFLRIGNRRPFGWVSTRDALTWDSRLTLRLPEKDWPISEGAELQSPQTAAITTEPVPVVGWEDSAIRIALWKPDQPWEGIDRQGWIDAASIPADSWCVLLSRDEVLALIGELSKGPNATQIDDLRDQAILGRLGGTQPLGSEDRREIRQWLPSALQNRHAPSVQESMERLSRLNEEWTADARWSGRSFHAVSIDAVP